MITPFPNRSPRCLHTYTLIFSFLHCVSGSHACRLSLPRRSQANRSAFEFNVNLLVFLADEVYSCRFGTFLFNCEADARDARVAQRAMSVWSYVNHERHRLRFTNLLYSVAENERNELFVPNFVKDLVFFKVICI